MLTRIQILFFMALAALIHVWKRSWAQTKAGFNWVLDEPVRYLAMHVLILVMLVVGLGVTVHHFSHHSAPTRAPVVERMMRVQLLSPDSTIVESFTVPASALHGHQEAGYLEVMLPHGQEVWKGSYRILFLAAEAK